MKEPRSVRVADLIPHRPPIVMIDGLIEAEPERAVAVKTFRAGDYGLDGDDVTEPALVECMAQTTAAMHGFEKLAAGKSPGVGFLAGVSGFCIRRRPRRDELLTIEVRVAGRLGAMCLAKGKISREGRVLAEGDLKFYLP